MEEDEQTLEEQAFKELDQVFHQVLDELSNDPSLEKFRLEYEKLYRTLKVSHENEKKLLKRCKELNDDIVSNTAKVQTALKLTQEDSQTISFLKTELEKTYKLLELTKEREQKSKEKISALDTEIKNLNNLIEQGNELSSGQSNRVHELLIVKDELLKEKEMLNAIIQNVRHEFGLNEEKLKNLEEEKTRIIKNIESTQEDISEKEKTTQMYEEKKRKLQDELEQIKKNFDQTHLDHEKVITEKVELGKENESITQQLRKLNQTLEAMEKNKKQVIKEAEESHWRVEDQRNNNDNLEQQQIKAKDNLAEIEKELADAKKKQEFLQNNLVKYEIQLKEIKEQKEEAEKVKELTKQGVNELEKESGSIHKQTMEAHSIIDELKRTRDILLKEVNRVDNNNKKQEEELNMKVKLEKEKKNEVMGYNQELERKRKKIGQLEKEKEKYGVQASQANAKYFHSLEEIKLKDNLISEFQKKNIETEAKLKQQQNLYETVRSDRNYESKRVTERQEELVELKRKYKISNHLISQLKEEIESKEKALTTEHLESKKKDKTMEEFKRQEDKYETDAKQKDDKILEFKKGIAKLHFIIKESEQQKQKLKEEYDLVVAERDILGTQLIRRNEEAHLLHEKIKINQSYLSKGEAQYRDRLIDIEKLKQRIADLLSDISGYNTNAAQVEDLRNEMHNLSKELTEEKLKVKSLSEEIENPINVHRWRKLEATDSETYELMTKIHTLQKRLIAKTEEVEQKEQLIQSKEKNIKELRDIMKRQPGIEEANMIQVYQSSLKQKLEQMKAMAKEMNMYQAEISQYKFEVDRLSSDLGDVKKKFYQQKKREQFESEKEQSKPLTIQINMPEKRIAGGGFNLVI